MNIHEYQAKQLLKEYGVNTICGEVATSKDQINFLFDKINYDKYVVKAQIHAGGRGKAGGVKITDSKEEAIKLAHEMYGMNLVTHQTGKEGKEVKRIYVEPASNIVKEYYLSAVLDRAQDAITFIVSTEGGTDIEEVAKTHPEKIVKVVINNIIGLQSFHLREIIYAFGFTDKSHIKQLSSIVKNIYTAMRSIDATQIEINPLAFTKEEQILALDAKINFDENALYRQEKIVSLRDLDEEDPSEIEAKKSDLSYIKMDGEIGCMVNGAGLAMATMDIIKLYGKSPANFLDVGGSANTETVTKAFKIILSDKNVKAILVNIFGGIMKCDVIAEGIIMAAKEMSIKVPLVVRLSGTNFELGKKILNESGLNIIAADDLEEAAKKVTRSV